MLKVLEVCIKLIHSFIYIFARQIFQLNRKAIISCFSDRFQDGMKMTDNSIGLYCEKLFIFLFENNFNEVIIQTDILNPDLIMTFSKIKELNVDFQLKIIESKEKVCSIASLKKSIHPNNDFYFVLYEFFDFMANLNEIEKKFQEWNLDVVVSTENDIILDNKYEAELSYIGRVKRFNKVNSSERGTVFSGLLYFNKDILNRVDEENDQMCLIEYLFFKEINEFKSHAFSTQLANQTA